MQLEPSAGRHWWEGGCQCLLDAVFPPRCAGCGAYGNSLFCAACAPQLKPIRAPYCRICGIPFDPLAKAAEVCARCRDNRYHAAPPFRTARAVFEFEGPLREAVHRFKYYGKTALAEPLARLMAEYLQAELPAQPELPVEAAPVASPAIPWRELAMIVPVPLFGWRLYRRGYNQSTLLARHLGRQIGAPVAELLCRTRHTTPQVRLSAREREENVRGAFSLHRKIARDGAWNSGPLLLVDDVSTTGSTLRECAAVLKKAGATEVYALTLARQL